MRLVTEVRGYLVYLLLPCIFSSVPLKNKHQPPLIFSALKSLSHPFISWFWLSNIISHFLSPKNTWFNFIIHPCISSPYSNPRRKRPGLQPTGWPRIYLLKFPNLFSEDCTLPCTWDNPRGPTLSKAQQWAGSPSGPCGSPRIKHSGQSLFFQNSERTCYLTVILKDGRYKNTKYRESSRICTLL